MAYLPRAKQLNSRQARWALFLGRFSFSLTYLPGSKNTKPAALSRQFSADPVGQDPKAILPPTCIVMVADWQVEEHEREAQRSAEEPRGAPPNTLFVPEAALTEVLQLAHSSRLACHPLVACTLHLLRQRNILIW